MKTIIAVILFLATLPNAWAEDESIYSVTEQYDFRDYKPADNQNKEAAFSFEKHFKKHKVKKQATSQTETVIKRIPKNEPAVEAVNAKELELTSSELPQRITSVEKPSESIGAELSKSFNIRLKRSKR